MEIIHAIADMREAAKRAAKEGMSIALVPTMGALHAGHMSLVRQARSENGFTVVSVFVNPTQFGPTEDYNEYPRDLASDSEKCRDAGVDVVFAPAVEQMYPEGYSTHVDVDSITELLEGAMRPGHFRGVATVVLKLVDIVRPDRAYFGMKDYQQLLVIRKMVRDLDVGVDVVGVPTVREPDGLAMSSRNAYLNAEERKAATVLYRSLEMARGLVEQEGLRDAAAVRAELEGFIATEPLAQPDYIAVADPETLQPLGDIGDQALVALAVRIGSTRLIDNMLITRQESNA